MAHLPARLSRPCWTKTPKNGFYSNRLTCLVSLLLTLSVLVMVPIDGEMLSTAGLGVAFEGKPALKQKIDTQLDHTDLTGLLYLQGLTADKLVDAI